MSGSFSSGSLTSGLQTGTSYQICSSIRLEIKCTVNVICLNHPETIPLTLSLWKSCLPQNQSLVLKRLGTAAIAGVFCEQASGTDPRTRALSVSFLKAATPSGQHDVLRVPWKIMAQAEGAWRVREKRLKLPGD